MEKDKPVKYYPKEMCSSHINIRQKRLLAKKKKDYCDKYRYIIHKTHNHSGRFNTFLTIVDCLADK